MTSTHQANPAPRASAPSLTSHNLEDFYGLKQRSMQTTLIQIHAQRLLRLLAHPRMQHGTLPPVLPVPSDKRQRSRKVTRDTAERRSCTHCDMALEDDLRSHRNYHHQRQCTHNNELLEVQRNPWRYRYSTGQVSAPRPE